MLVSLTDRGPDSTGFAVYGKGARGKTKLTLRGRAGEDFAKIARPFAARKLKVVDNAPEYRWRRAPR